MHTPVRPHSLSSKYLGPTDTVSVLYVTIGQTVLSPNKNYNFFHNLYISEKCVRYWLQWVCGKYDVIV